MIEEFYKMLKIDEKKKEKTEKEQEKQLSRE